MLRDGTQGFSQRHRYRVLDSAARHRGQNTGHWPVRPAGILPAAASDRFEQSKTPLGAQAQKSVFLSSGRPKKKTR